MDIFLFFVSCIVVKTCSIPLNPTLLWNMTHPVFGMGPFYPPRLHHCFSPLWHRSKPRPQAFGLSSFAAAHEQQER